MGKSNAKSFLAGLLAPADAASDENSDSNGREARSHEAPLLQASPTSSTRPVITDEDAETVLLFLDGSEQAFLRLYAKYETPLLLYLRRMVDGEAMAEDLFQETWIRIFELRKRRTEVGCFKALLFRTAKNLCLNAIRSEQHRSGSSEMLEMVRSLEKDDDKAPALQALAPILEKTLLPQACAGSRVCYKILRTSSLRTATLRLPPGVLAFFAAVRPPPKAIGRRQ